MVKSGAPKGNTNAAKGRRWASAIDKALSLRSNGDAQAALVMLAGKLLDAAEAGDQWAIRELGDRIDGKAAQSVMLVNDDAEDANPIRVVVEMIDAGKHGGD